MKLELQKTQGYGKPLGSFINFRGNNQEVMTVNILQLMYTRLSRKQSFILALYLGLKILNCGYRIK